MARTSASPKRPVKKPSARAGKKAKVTGAKQCNTCAADLAFLRTTERPDYESGANPVRIVDLFSGGGGMSVGAAEAARRAGRGAMVALAAEHDDGPADVYALNFPTANLERADVARLFDGKIGAGPTSSERKLARDIGDVDVLLAGPPCQGHSDLNNHTRRKDPRNALYLRVARAAEVLRPTFVVIENVPAVQHDKGKVVTRSTDALEAMGYAVASKVLDLVRFGVPQRRRRHILLAVRGDLVDPAVILDMRSPCDTHDERSVQWGIGDLATIESVSLLDRASKPTPTNLERMHWLIDNDKYDLPNPMRPKCHHDEHTYNAMYGRLAWGDPAPTITTGFGSMGQGRFVHPASARTLTPHEAARLQTLPDFFDLDVSKGRGAWATVIGNAVPPLLGVHLVEPLLCALPVEPTNATEARPTARGRAGVKTKRSRGVPQASSQVIRERMTNTKRRDTQPELALRSALHAMGLRYSVDRAVAGTRGRIDIAFPTERVAVYVDGCFWHSCPEHGTVPKQNNEWWVEKLAANKTRDQAADERLRAAGWTVLRFWEHDDPRVAAKAVRGAVIAARRAAKRANGRPRTSVSHPRTRMSR